MVRWFLSLVLVLAFCSAVQAQSPVLYYMLKVGPCRWSAQSSDDGLGFVATKAKFDVHVKRNFLVAPNDPNTYVLHAYIEQWIDPVLNFAVPYGQPGHVVTEAHWERISPVKVFGSNEPAELIGDVLHPEDPMGLNHSALVYNFDTPRHCVALFDFAL